MISYFEDTNNTEEWLLEQATDQGHERAIEEFRSTETPRRELGR